MATLTTLVDGQLAIVAPVNANFQALNTDLVAAQGNITTLTAAAGNIRMLYSSSTGVGTVGTGEDVLHTYDLPAGTLTASGDGLVIDAFVFFNSNANTKTLKWYLGSQAITLNPTTTAPNNQFAVVQLRVWRQSATAAYLAGVVHMANWIGGTSATTEMLVGSTSLSPTWANVNTIKFTGEGTSNSDIIQEATTIAFFRNPV